MAKDMARELAKQMLAQSARLSPTLSPEQSRARQNTAQIAAAWQAQGANSRNSWLQLAQAINAREARFGRQAFDGYRTFFLVSSTLLNAGQALLTTAPADYAPPAGLPPMLLLAGLAGADQSGTPSIGGGGGLSTGGFVLTINSSALTGIFQIWGSKPTLPDKVLRPAHDFTLLGTKTALGAQTDIADLYLAKFDAPTPGAKVPVQVVAVSPQGFKGTPLLLTAVAQAGAAAKPAHGDNTLLKAA